MDAVKFLKVKNRMCKGNDCFVCPLGNEEGGCQVGSRVNQRVTEEQLVEIVEKLKAEHPIKTRQSMIIKEFPNIEMIGDVIDLRPCDMDTEINCPAEINGCTECKKRYWLAEVEE